MFRAAVVVESPHHGNTRRIAEAISEVLAADLLTVDEAMATRLAKYDLVGLGSGIYFGRHHRALRRLVACVDKLPRDVFLFSTAGLPCLSWLWHRSLKRHLKRRGCHVIGEFGCAGWDTVGPLKLFGGINRGHPAAQDLSSARDFANALLALRERTAAPTSDATASLFRSH